MASDKTLLQTLDDAASTLGMVFGGAVIRRALKVLLHEDVKKCSFEKMMSESYKIIMERFIVDEQNKSESGEDFFAISVSQVFLKMIKAVLIQRKDWHICSVCDPFVAAVNADTNIFVFHIYIYI